MLPSASLDVDRFLREAVAFCNERCWGTLSCSISIDPQTQRRHSDAFDAAIADLKYGTIVINAPPFMGFLPAGTWGAYPGEAPLNRIHRQGDVYGRRVGNVLSDVGSGNCMVHNTSLYDYPEKTVCYAPWQLYPVAFWTDITHKDALMDAFVQFCLHPGVISLLRTVGAALQAA